VFVGYPSGYKGWKFYNPSPKKYIISEQAEFDERIFPGLAKYTATSPVDLTSPKTVPLLPDTTPDMLLNLEGDGDVDDRTTVTLPVPVPELPLAPLAPLDPPVDLPPPQLPVLLNEDICQASPNEKMRDIWLRLKHMRQKMERDWSAFSQ